MPKTRADMEKSIRAMAGDGFNADFEELLINRVATALKCGVPKETVLKFIDLMIDATGKDVG